MQQDMDIFLGASTSGRSVPFFLTPFMSDIHDPKNGDHFLRTSLSVMSVPTRVFRLAARHIRNHRRN